MNTILATLRAQGRAILCGPHGTGKFPLLRAVEHVGEYHVRYFNMESWATQPDDQCVAEIKDILREESAKAARERKLLAIFDRTEHLYGKLEATKKLSALRVDRELHSLWIANLPKTFIELAELFPEERPSSELCFGPIVEQTYFDQWDRLGTYVDFLGDRSQGVVSAIRKVVNDHSILGELLLDAIRSGTLKQTSKPDALMYVWPELASGPLRPFLQERGSEIRQDDHLMTACRHLFESAEGPPRAYWDPLDPSLKRAYLRLAEWGIVQADKHGEIRPGSDLLKQWLRRDFAGGPVIRGATG